MCWYYRLQEIEKYDFMVDPNGMRSVRNLIEKRLAVFELNHADRQTRPALCVFISCTSFKEHVMIQDGGNPAEI
jgi:hypothetical protein